MGEITSFSISFDDGAGQGGPLAWKNFPEKAFFTSLEEVLYLTYYISITKDGKINVYPDSNYLFKVNNRIVRKVLKICSNLTIKTLTL